MGLKAPAASCQIMHGKGLEHIVEPSPALSTALADTAFVEPLAPAADDARTAGPGHTPVIRTTNVQPQFIRCSLLAQYR
jgi:hypothetical protein